MFCFQKRCRIQNITTSTSVKSCWCAVRWPCCGYVNRKLQYSCTRCNHERTYCIITCKVIRICYRGVNARTNKQNKLFCSILKLCICSLQFVLHVTSSYNNRQTVMFTFALSTSFSVYFHTTDIRHF